MGSSWNGHLAPMRRSWSMKGSWDAHGVPMGRPWAPHESSMRSSQPSHGFPLGRSHNCQPPPLTRNVKYGPRQQCIYTRSISPLSTDHPIFVLKPFGSQPSLFRWKPQPLLSSKRLSRRWCVMGPRYPCHNHCWTRYAPPPGHAPRPLWHAPPSP